MIYDRMPEENRDSYRSYLSIVGSLSSLFSQNNTAPYLYYRAAEKLYCDAFNAQDRSRSDVSVDATYQSFGIGLKTFLHGNGHTLQKVAEFNALRPKYNEKTDLEIVRFISEARNDRLLTTSALYDIKSLMYHVVTRLEKEFRIYETDMSLINIDDVCKKGIKRKGNTISFTDNIKEYSFNLSKSTLYQRFKLNQEPLDVFEVLVLDNPIELLRKLLENIGATKPALHAGIDFIYLPLYSTASGNGRYGKVPEKSGLNQWNADGRTRHSDELYIPIPRLIHKNFPKFLPDNNNIIFTIELPNGQKLQAKLCQQGSKGLMSNPNRALGHWLLRDVFRLEEGELATNDTLLQSGIDSVYIEKINERLYKIDFAAIGKYEEFIDTYAN